MIQDNVGLCETGVFVLKTYKARITFLLAMIGVLVLCMESYSLNADEGGTTNFRQDPTMDFRAVHLDIEKDKVIKKEFLK